MTTTKKNGKKAGVVHRKTRQQPIRQRDPQVREDQQAVGKPDFDEKDRSRSPKRKTPGPDKGRRRARPASSAASTKPSTPEVKIKQDDHDSK